MKKNILVLFFSFLGSVFYSQVNDSVLSNGSWFKFAVDTTGVFKIDKALLEVIGISTNGLNPKKIRIFGNGGQMLPELNSTHRYNGLQENSIYIKGEDDGSFDDEDYILFYAKGPHDWEVNTASNTANHRQNIFSDKAYYFITASEENGKRINQKKTVTTSNTIPITSYDDYTFYEKDEKNILATGTQWFFNKDFNITDTQNFEIPFPNPLENSDIKIKIRAVSSSTVFTSMEVEINNEKLNNISFSPANTFTVASISENTYNIRNNENKIEITLRYNNSGYQSANTFLDYIEVIGKKKLTANGEQFTFRSFEQANANNFVNFTIQNNANIFQIWDVTNPIEPLNINNENSGENFVFKDLGGALKEYVVLNENDFYTPEAIENNIVANQNLHLLKDLNYIVITNSELSATAQRLVDYHQNNSNLTAKVILLDEIYNEFSSGSKDITAIRDFLKHLYTNNTSEEYKLKYVCFFGDSSYDYKDRIIGNNNIVPVKLSENSFNLASSYTTDDYYVMLDDNEGSLLSSHTIDVASSRIPVSTIEQANQVVDKILNYYSKNSSGEWRNTITFLADDVDQTGEEVLQQETENIADYIKTNNPNFNVNKIYADSYVQENLSGGERYSEVNSAVLNSIEKGSLIFNYFGHGGEDGFAAERILEKQGVQSLNNINTLPLFITVTCDFSRFDNPARVTAGELMLWNAQGGAASMITTTREVFISVGQLFNSSFIKTLLETNNDLTIAEALMKTKNKFSNSQKLFIYYFGDPATKLAVPKPNIKITKMNGKDISQSLDTLKALSKVSIEGIVVDENNSILNDFNGTLSTIIYDKATDKTTLDNDGFGIKMTYDEQNSKLFKGKSTVKNGVFKFDFIVPKDIKTFYGNGKLSFYAYDSSNNTDRAGHNFDFVIGGIDENAAEDNEGPEINVFINNEFFIEGNNTNESPNLTISLSDKSGINTSISSVDHDIVAILDGNTKAPIILNDFYQAEENDFTKGKVTYTLRGLEVGPHSLKIKAWDTYNNSSEVTLNFIVISDETLILENVFNSPNPFVNYTEFWFKHNLPKENLEVQISIFTITGRLIKTINQNVLTTGSSNISVSWDGLDDFNNKIGSGIYIYKLTLKSAESNLVAQKIKKLIILP